MTKSVTSYGMDGSQLRLPRFIPDLTKTLQAQGNDEIELCFVHSAGSGSMSIPRGMDDFLAGHLAAVTIANHSVIYGAHTVWVQAEEPFVDRVRRIFDARVNVPENEGDEGVMSGTLRSYLGVFNRQPFSIRTWPRGTPRPSAEPVGTWSVPAGSLPGGLAVGLDVGFGTTKGTLLRRVGSDVRVLAMGECATKGETGSPYTIDALLDRLSMLIIELCESARVDVASEVDCVGLSWPGAVWTHDGPGRISGTSKTLRYLEGFDQELFQEISELPTLLQRRLETKLGSQAATEGRLSTFMGNDGNIEAFYAAQTLGLTDVVLCKLGSTVAGGIVDANGATGHLAEIGRCVIRVDEAAPAHPFTSVKGVASVCVGSWPLLARARQSGVDAEASEPIHIRNVGKILGLALGGANETSRLLAEEVLDEMAQHVAYLLVELNRQIPAVKHILLRGGLGSRLYPAGRFVRERTRQWLDRIAPELDLWARVVREERDRHSGAVAAAAYALARAERS